MMRGFRQTTIHSTFDKISKRMPLYEYVYVNFTFSMKGQTYGLAHSQFQPYYKCILDVYIFENFDLLSQVPGV